MAGMPGGKVIRRLLGRAAIGLFALLAAACSSGAVPSIQAAHGDRGVYPIEKTLGEARAVAIVTVSDVGEPRWNSEDGRPWADEYARNKDAYVNVPYQYTNVSVVIDEVIVQDSRVPLTNGKTIEVQVFGDPSLSRAESRAGITIVAPRRFSFAEEGAQRVVMLERIPYPASKERGPEIWRADYEYGFWGFDKGARMAIPGSFAQQRELDAERSRWAASKSSAVWAIPFPTMREAHASAQS